MILAERCECLSFVDTMKQAKHASRCCFTNAKWCISNDQMSIVEHATFTEFINSEILHS